MVRKLVENQDYSAILAIFVSNLGRLRIPAPVQHFVLQSRIWRMAPTSCSRISCATCCMRKLVLLGRQGGKGRQGEKQKIHCIHAYLKLMCRESII